MPKNIEYTRGILRGAINTREAHVEESGERDERLGRLAALELGLDETTVEKVNASLWV